MQQRRDVGSFASETTLKAGQRREGRRETQDTAQRGEPRGWTWGYCATGLGGLGGGRGGEVRGGGMGFRSETGQGVGQGNVRTVVGVTFGRSSWGLLSAAQQ